MDIIKITDLEIFAYHGVLPEETEKGQIFLVSVDVFTDISKVDDNIEKTIDYAKLSQDIKDFMTGNTFKLIETAADKLAYAILRMYQYKIKKVRVEVKKPKFNASAEVERRWHTAYISAGSNMGDRQAFIAGAMDAFIFTEDCILTNASTLLETKPYGAVKNQPDFLNGCFEIKTLLPPAQLLKKLQSIENAAGRIRTQEKGPRTLDLDILFYDDIVLDTKDLTIPHPDMHNRRFVLEPLAKIAPAVKHPVFGKTVTEMLKDLKG